MPFINIRKWHFVLNVTAFYLLVVQFDSLRIMLLIICFLDFIGLICFVLTLHSLYCWLVSHLYGWRMGFFVTFFLTVWGAVHLHMNSRVQGHSHVRGAHMWRGHSHVEVLIYGGDIHMWVVLLSGGYIRVWTGRATKVKFFTPWYYLTL